MATLTYFERTEAIGGAQGRATCGDCPWMGEELKSDML